MEFPNRVRAAVRAGVPVIESADEVERDQLVLLLRGLRGDVAKAARELQVSRQTIYRRVERYGLDLMVFRGLRPA